MYLEITGMKFVKVSLKILFWQEIQVLGDKFVIYTDSVIIKTLKVYKNSL